MLELPIPNKAGKDFLDGKGHFKIDTDQDAWKLLADNNQPFSKDKPVVADVTLDLDQGSKQFEFGRDGGLKLGISGSAGFSHQVRILWPDKDSDAAEALQYGLIIPQKSIYARLQLSGQAAGAADAKFPVGPLSATVGVGAGGHAKYERWLLAAANAPALQVLTDLYGGLRLPQSIDQSNELPADGELLVLGYGGYLKLNAGLSWGYELKGSKSIDIPRMPLDLNYQLRAMASVDVGFQIAGEYQIEARKAADKWVRFTVRKSRSSETTLAADFGFTGEYTLSGLPGSADEFLSKLFGAHADRILELFHQGQKYSDLKNLEEAAGKLLKSTVQKYSDQVLGIVLSDATVQDVIQKMQQVAGVYANFDQRIIDLYHDVLKEVVPPGQQAILLKTINAFLGAAKKEDLAGLSGTPQFAAIVDLLRRLYNEKLFDVFQTDATFAEAAGLLKHAKDFIEGNSAADDQIKQWIDMVQKEVPFNDLLKQLAGMDEAALKNLAEEKLQGLVEKIVGKTFATMNDTDFAKAAALVHKNFKKIDDFKNKFYADAVKQVTHQSFQMDLHLAYSRARKNEKLLEVEVNLAHPDGRGAERANAAAAGDYQDLLKNYDTTAVRVIKGVFSTELRNSMSVKFNVLGFGTGGLVTLFERSEQALEPRDGGLLHVFTSETYIERKKTAGGKFKETVDSKFLVQAVGESFQKEGTSVKPYAIDVLRSMTSSFDLLQSDEDTRPEELTEYLRFAGELGLLDQEPRLYVQQLTDACGGNLGKVKLTYRVGFDVVALHSAFKFAGPADPHDLDGGELGRNVRKAMRAFIWRKFASSDARDWFPRVAFAYASDVFYKLYRQHALTSEPRGVTMPGWFTGIGTQQVSLRPMPDLALLDRLFRFEDDMVAGVLAVDDQVDALDNLPPGGTVDWEKLNAAILKMVKAAGSVAEYDDSCFAVILDRLIQTSTNGTAKRDSTLLLEVTPSKGPVKGTITRLISPGPKNPTEIATDEAAQLVSVVAGGK